jgi:hypothetical protein
VPSLPWARTIDHHKSISYAETEVTVTVPFTVDRHPGGRRVTFTVSGHCPACGGLTTKEFSYGIAGTKGPSTPPVTPVEPATVYCECGHLHPDKPPAATDDGCGRYWQIDLTTP